MGDRTTVPLPVCKAILLCDKVSQSSPRTLDLVGVFSNFFVDKTLTGRSAEAFCQVTDAMGRYEFVAEIHDLFANEIIARSPPTSVEVEDRLMTTDVIISMPPLKFSHRELHDLVVFANGEEIDRRSFGVAEIGSDADVLTS